MEVNRELVEINENKVDANKAREILKVTQEKQQDLIKNRKKYREDELLDLYSTEIDREDKKLIQRRIKIL